MSRKKYITIANVLKIAAVAIIIGMGTIAGIFAVAASNLPTWNPQQLSGAKTTFLYDENDQVMAKLHAEENRTEISLDKVPQDLINAVIATEDKEFYKHHGVNLKAIIRAVVYNIQSGDLTAQGASTITQQLARNAFLSLDKRWERKIKEIILAFKLEANYSKDEILTMYLNMIPFGSGAYGVQAAANTYFGKDAGDLNLAECALIAGLPQSPNYYNPFQHYDRAKVRQRIVLNNMVECGFIDQETADNAYETPLVFKKTHDIEAKYGYFIDAVIEEALAILKEKGYKEPDNAIYRDGLRIYTTMDAKLQQHAETVYASSDNFPNQSKNGEQIQSAMVVISHSNGEVKAVMGGRKYEYKRGFNRATDAYRQPGSAIKPLTVYGPALENGFMPFYVLDDSPISYKIGNQIWNPQNYDHKYRGLITMRTAVQWSINTYAVQMLNIIGIRSGYDFGKALGLELIDTPGTNDLGLAPLSLGGLTRGATPLQMAAAYGAFGNGGIYIRPHFIRKIVDADGVEIYEHSPEYHRVMTEETAWLMNSLLQTVCTSGTGTNAKVPGVITAGKTGTSEEYKDSWFCGFTPGYSAAVWMGYDQEHTMYNVYGGGYPAKIFRSMMQKAHEDNNLSPKAMPPDIIKIAVCSKSGKLPSEICPAEQVISEYCLKQCVPSETCDVHQLVTICKESGKIATQYCPETETLAKVKTSANSHDPEKIPAETCDIHTEFNIPETLRNIIKEHTPFSPGSSESDNMKNQAEDQPKQEEKVVNKNKRE
ncbi:MAG: penicillin-binding protein 1A [Syntrophomonadaceae bacterium]|nr:penicillin-binding protein 1A [Syntrophomonadaceae bacterium]